MTMTTSENFKILVNLDNARRVAFQFSLFGTKQSGVVYINRNIADGADLMKEAAIASKIACKRAGATEATLHAIVNPTR